MTEFGHICPESHFWDQWSVGIVILEILVGSDLILLANTYKRVVRLFNDSLEFLDDVFGTMIKGLLFDDCYFDLDSAAQNFSRHPENLTAISVRMMNAALKEDRNLKNWQEKF